MWIKIHYNKNILTSLEFLNFKIFDQIKGFKFFWKGKNKKSPSVI